MEQRVIVLESPDKKWLWIAANIQKIMAKGHLLFFVNSQAKAEDIAKGFKEELNIDGVFVCVDLIGLI